MEWPSTMCITMDVSYSACSIESSYIARGFICLLDTYFIRTFLGHRNHDRVENLSMRVFH